MMSKVKIGEFSLFGVSPNKRPKKEIFPIWAFSKQIGNFPYLEVLKTNRDFSPIWEISKMGLYLTIYPSRTLAPLGRGARKSPPAQGCTRAKAKNFSLARARVRGQA